jgi:hypothetical protein
MFISFLPKKGRNEINWYYIIQKTMQKICKNIEIIHASYVASISGSDIVPVTGESIQPMKSISTVLTEKQKTENGNPLFEQTIEVKTDDMLSSYINLWHDPHMIVKLRLDDGNIKIVGTPDNPCLVSHDKDEYSYTVVFSHLSDSPLF